MNDENTPALVTGEWLAVHIDDANISIVDGSWHMPALQRDARAEFAQVHIPGAVYFDIDDISDKANPLPHMIPSAPVFADKVGALGIGNGQHVVCYDATGMGSAARVWWMFRLFGHNKVSVLDGGLAQWQNAGRAVEAGTVSPPLSKFQAHKNEALVRTAEQVIANLQTKHEQVLDARSAGRFNATEPEPRKGLRGGRIPGSFNRPFVDLYDTETKTMKPVATLTSLFDESGIKRDQAIVTSCGSGVTACNLALGLYLSGKTDVAIFDGSWTEWGSREDTPVEA